MIGLLPKSLNVGGKEQAIETDYRIALKIFVACDDVELNDSEKMEVMLRLLYKDFESIDPSDYQQAIDQALWFLNGGNMLENNKLQSKKVMDWEQDESMIFSAINKVAGYEVRAIDYLHLWSFLGFYCEMGEGLFQTILSIRMKRNKGKKLEKHEQEFFNENKELIVIKEKYTDDEQSYIDKLREIIGVKGG